MTRICALIAFVLLPLAACDVPLGGLTDGGRAQVDAVQQSYDTAFRSALAAEGVDAGQARFSDTLALINRTRGDDPRVNAYLDVLEGMIYLQTGQTGLAAAMAPEVGAAAGHLRRGAVYPRDALFAQNFAAMVQGRQAMAALEAVRGTGAGDLARVLSATQALDAAADRITANLCTARRGNALAAPADDAGAAMVAGFGATYRVAADAGFARYCAFNPPEPSNCTGFATRNQLTRARNLRATFSGDIAPGSQLGRLDGEINNRLTTFNRGAALPAAQNACG